MILTLLELSLTYFYHFDFHQQCQCILLHLQRKKRVGIAGAISIEPSLLVCDEPTASLDVTVQVQILGLLKELQRTKNLTVLIIAHDIRVVSYLCEKVIVLKNGSIVDFFELSDLYWKERHEYTKALIKAASLDE